MSLFHHKWVHYLYPLQTTLLRSSAINYYTQQQRVSQYLRSYDQGEDVEEGGEKVRYGVLSTLFIISYSTPIFVAVILPVGAIYYFVQRFCVATSGQLGRLESMARSPIYSHFGESVAGATSIRAYGLREKFIQESDDKVDFHIRSSYLHLVLNRWLSVRLETVGHCIIFFAALFAVLGRDKLSASIVGLSVSYAHYRSLKLSDVEMNIVAVESIKEFEETPHEAEWELQNENISADWLQEGDISFNNFQVRYRKNLELVLRGISFSVADGQKVGIVARTGARKSSLTLSLFRILESAGGKILIDGVDISTLGLHTLRSRLTIIPQDPVLFSGTLRINLDPVGKHSDESMWRAQELAPLKTYVASLNFGLQHKVTEGGKNFSVGQRQLICLSRALLRITKVLVLDEATAAVDLKTDDLIQRTIRQEFKDGTILTIAHRLNTVVDYDRIIVLDRGYVVEYESPAVLLQSKSSNFYRMAVDAGLS